MKKLIFIACFFLAIKVTAQGNLQFNQVLTYTQQYATSGSPNTYLSPTYQVPTGKVWKVEKFLMSASSTSYPTYLRINNVNIIQEDDVNSGPVWLKPGDQINAYTSVTGGGGYTGSYFISIIEFNIVP